jgi:hypothetical protein
MGIGMLQLISLVSENKIKFKILKDSDQDSMVTDPALLQNEPVVRKMAHTQESPVRSSPRILRNASSEALSPSKQMKRILRPNEEGQPPSASATIAKLPLKGKRIHIIQSGKKRRIISCRSEFVH